MVKTKEVDPIKLTKFLKSELCPCGSGKEYKSCCLNAKDKPDKDIERKLNNDGYINHCIIKKYKKTDFEECIYPDKSKCKGKIINAHTLQNNAILSQLAVKDHVMICSTKVDVNGIKVQFKKESKNSATTFLGFCKEHDDRIFAPIEKSDFSYNGETQQIFLFAYRAFSQEYHKKMRMMTSFKDMIKNRPSLTKNQGFIPEYREKQLEMYDIEEYKKIFDACLIEESYDIFESISIELNQKYDFAVTTMVTLSTDIEGNIINDIYSYDYERLKSCFITIIPLNDRENTLILLSWLKEDSETFQEYKRQFQNLNEEELKTYINNLLPMYTENIVLSPRLWDKLTNFSKRELEKVLGSEFPRLDEEIDLTSLINSKFRTKEDYLIKPKYDLFKL